MRMRLLRRPRRPSSAPAGAQARLPRLWRRTSALWRCTPCTRRPCTTWGWRAWSCASWTGPSTCQPLVPGPPWSWMPRAVPCLASLCLSPRLAALQLAPGVRRRAVVLAGLCWGSGSGAKHVLYLNRHCRYRAAIAVAPDCAEAHNNLGTIYRGLGQVQLAVASYRAALDVRPTFPQVGLRRPAAVSTSLIGPVAASPARSLLAASSPPQRELREMPNPAGTKPYTLLLAGPEQPGGNVHAAGAHLGGAGPAARRAGVQSRLRRGPQQPWSPAGTSLTWAARGRFSAYSDGSCRMHWSH